MPEPAWFADRVSFPRFRTLPLLVLVVLLSVGCDNGLAPTDQQAPREFEVNLSDDCGEIRDMDLGRIIRGQHLEHTFVIRNTTARDIEIIDIERSCSCEAPNVTLGMQLASGAILEIPYRIPTSRAGEILAKLTLRTNATDPALETIVLTLKGWVEAIGSDANVESTPAVATGVLRHPPELIEKSPDERSDTTFVVKPNRRSGRIDGLAVAANTQEDGSNSDPDKTIERKVQLPEPTPPAMDILRQMKAVMSLPIRYRLFRGSRTGPGQLVAQKREADGSLSSRIEIPLPISPMTKLLHRGNAWKFYSNEGVALEVPIWLEEFQREAEEFASLIPSAVEAEGWDPPVVVEAIELEGDIFYRIEMTLSDQSRLQIERLVPREARNLTPARRLFLINSRDHVLRSLESLTPTGSSLSKHEFREVAIHPEIPGDAFQPPAGAEIRIVTSLPEYIAETKSIVKKLQAERLVKPLPPLVPERPKVATDEELRQQNRERLEVQRHAHEEQRERDLGQRVPAQLNSDPDGGIRLWVILLNLIFLIVVLTTVVSRRVCRTNG